MQNFLYTGQLLAGDEDLPGYDVLIATWKLGHEFGIPKLCEKTLETMKGCRRVTQSIPATPLLIQAWKDTPEASDLRKLLLDWATEYLRSSDPQARTDFSKSLPKEVLADLVLEMSNMDSKSMIQVGSMSPSHGQMQHKNVHYLEAEDKEGNDIAVKSPRRSSSDTASRHHAQADQPVTQRKPLPRISRTPVKTTRPRQSSTNGYEYKDLKMVFCSDLINRMLSGPGRYLQCSYVSIPSFHAMLTMNTVGFWTRLVPLFREPVDPEENGIPDYFEKIKRPMDLGTIRQKMNDGEYDNEEQFVTDVRQIFKNCYTYWDEGTTTWEACKKLEKTFEEKYSNMHKWLLKQTEEEA